MRLVENVELFIERAEQVGPFALRLTFSDGRSGTVDFEPFLRRSQNPLIQEFLKPERFENFEISNGDLVWGDYELCFPIAALYEGKL